MWIDFLRWVHVLGAIVFLGTGTGIAFFMLMAHRTQNAALIAHTARIVVLADWVFTTSAVLVMPVTGVWLALALGWPLTQGWVLAALLLYSITIALWIPVVWMQTRMRNLASRAVQENLPLPAGYHRLFRLWFIFGVPAFVTVLAILWLMIARPTLGGR